MVERARDFKLSIGSAIPFITISPDPIANLWWVFEMLVCLGLPGFNG
jgi:hypothetical protein